MTLRIPLVVVSGQIQQLQGADTLTAPQTGGDQVILQNNVGVAAVIGTPVYVDSPGTFKLAQADVAATQKAAGLVGITSIANGASDRIHISGGLTATTAQWDAVTGQVGGLTSGATYYLDPATAGRLTTTAPVTVGQYVAEIGTALSTTVINVQIQPTILL